MNLKKCWLQSLNRDVQLSRSEAEAVVEGIIKGQMQRLVVVLGERPFLPRIHLEGEWSGMSLAWLGMAWHGLARLGMAWHGLARLGMAWHGLAWA